MEMERWMRQLHVEDLDVYQSMETGIEDDYIARFFERISSGNNRLFGLFEGEDLIATAGYTLFAGRYAMLGRLRASQAIRGKNIGTDVLTRVLELAKQDPAVDWIGANTEEYNGPAMRVLEKIQAYPILPQHAAVAKDVSGLGEKGPEWQEVTDLEVKRSWLNETYIRTQQPFPLQCYYPFPATESLFDEESLQEWRFFENADRSRYMILKKDMKRYHYTQVVYPWDDYFEQPGLWDTVAIAQTEHKEEVQDDVTVWLDLPKTHAYKLPADHPFDLSSIWVLHEAVNQLTREATKKAAR
ncbi:GNAT family N-acetyltransferase [Salisediminibacterium beveridgei]|uniref:N-acetyltransferase domain-containing protein n=1 Tax=Salisediminibacterium beveridgei TaxID=632773 RepID=A0A1D7QWU2_9BACI|nr:GNAT family N-acetyltransferase [Salisediminibacterium beveridgei]AOM83471.1 hypothetical protein BBEV_2113 [Salisediminibacterium beveridgei]